MSDEKLRVLERRWKETGSIEDEVAWLKERVRSGQALDWKSYSRLADLSSEVAAEYLKSRVEGGELTENQVQVASEAGFPPASIAVGKISDMHARGDCSKTVPSCISTMSQWETWVVVRWIVSIGEWCLLQSPRRAEDDDIRQALRALGAWSECPCDRCLDEARECADPWADYRGWCEGEEEERSAVETELASRLPYSAAATLTLGALSAASHGQLAAVPRGWVIWALTAMASHVELSIDEARRIWAKQFAAWLLERKRDPSRRLVLRALPLKWSEEWLLSHRLEKPYSDKKAIVRYLKSGFQIGLSSAVRRDPLSSTGTRVPPGKELTDGTWAWTSQLTYFVSKYDLCLPGPFLSFGRENGWVRPNCPDLDNGWLMMTD